MTTTDIEAGTCTCGHPETLHCPEPDGRRTECGAVVGNSYCGCAFFREATS